jgi:pimeloyl-ACP methyl ester carboxylesterase
MALLGTEHNIYRKDGKISVYKVGTDKFAGDVLSRLHGLPESGDPVIFLHSSGGRGDGWKPVVNIMAEQFVCYIIDSPGHGHSDTPPHKYMIGDFTNAVVDVLDALGLSRTNICGDHTGSMIAADLAVKHPARVKRMVLDGLPYWNLERGRVVWERFFVPQYTDTDAYDIPVSPLTTFEQARDRNPLVTREEWQEAEEHHRRIRIWVRSLTTISRPSSLGWRLPSSKTNCKIRQDQSTVLHSSNGIRRRHRGVESDRHWSLTTPAPRKDNASGAMALRPKLFAGGLPFHTNIPDWTGFARRKGSDGDRETPSLTVCNLICNVPGKAGRCLENQVRIPPVQ